MPIYQVHVTERHRERVEELHISSRDSYYDVSYEVEAGTEEEAIANYSSGEIVYSEFSDYGDYYDSEFAETLDVIESEFIDESIDNVEIISEDPQDPILDRIVIPTPQPGVPYTTTLQEMVARVMDTPTSGRIEVQSYAWDDVLQRVVPTTKLTPPPSSTPTWEV